MRACSRILLTAALAGLLGLGSSASAAGPELLVFAAASLTESIQEVGEAFEAQGGPAVKFSFGASSDLARQIQAGAPADVFFSADTAKMDDLEKAGLVRKGDRREFLSNRLAVVVPAGTSSAPKSAAELIAMPRIALADPASVPAGIYTKKWLESLGFWHQAEPKVVPTLDVRAALAAVETEAAPVAVVYTTDAVISRKVRVAFVVEKGPEIIYSVVPLAASKNPAATAFVAYLSGPGGKAVFEKRGFLVRGGGP
jgi:molybdate transport system substrate-binding protein